VDEELRRLIADRVDDKGQTRIATSSSGWLDEITIGNGEKAATYRLKPLAQLYGADSPTPSESTLKPLTRGIESQIAIFDVVQRGRLSDGDVLLALGKLAMGPDAEINNDILANRIQIGLRLSLSLGNFSRSAVKQALRRVAKAVEMRTTQAGTRGYLNSIRKHVRA
jgi:hypothetical protein